MVHEQLPMVHLGEDFNVDRRTDRLQMLCLRAGHESFERAVPEVDVGTGNRLQLIGIVTMFVIQMKNALRGLSAPAAWQTPEKFFI